LQVAYLRLGIVCLFDSLEFVPQVVRQLVCEEGAEEAFQEGRAKGAVVRAL
jgi:hypothetical protein